MPTATDDATSRARTHAGHVLAMEVRLVGGPLGRGAQALLLDVPG